MIGTASQRPPECDSWNRNAGCCERRGGHRGQPTPPGLLPPDRAPERMREHHSDVSRYADRGRALLRQTEHVDVKTRPDDHVRALDPVLPAMQLICDACA